MKFKHESLIHKCLDLYPNFVVFAKWATSDEWCVRTVGRGVIPSFGPNNEYAVVPVHHLEVAEAYYLKGKRIQCQKGVDGRWGDISEPNWDKDVIYRVAPEIPSHFKFGTVFCISDNYYLLSCVDGARFAMINLHSGNRYDPPALFRGNGEPMPSGVAIHDLWDHINGKQPAGEPDLFDVHEIPALVVDMKHVPVGTL